MTADQEKMTSIAQVIPQDIVQEIFVHIGGEDIVWLDVEHPKYFPWYLGHICSQWRITLLSMPPRGLKAGKHQRNKELAMNIVTYFLEWKRGHQSVRFSPFLLLLESRKYLDGHGRPVGRRVSTLASCHPEYLYQGLWDPSTLSSQGPPSIDAITAAHWHVLPAESSQKWSP
ncbi:hypothetical protein AX14_012083 [Amanita brunnescens Koide BX004]|nr:hypothetical protein AX14_012083 [Amanita brunnescens Koide BX004]